MRRIKIRKYTLEDLSDFYHLKIGTTVAQAGDNGQYLGAIESMRLHKGRLLRVTVNGVEHAAIDVCPCPDPATQLARVNECRRNAGLPIGEIDLS